MESPTSVVGATLPTSVDNLPQWALILIVVGAILVAVLSVVFGVYMFRRRRAHRDAVINGEKRDQFIKDTLRGVANQ